jgi:hypothetical protein
MLTRVWYTGAYGVKLNLLKDYLGAILMDRGDRHSWTGDAHPSQAASMAAFGNFDFIKNNLERTSGKDWIQSYMLYWVSSMLDYYNYTGDTELLKKYTENISTKLDDAYKAYGTNPKLGFYGHDERIGACFEIQNRDSQEAQHGYKMLSIRAWNDFARAMESIGRADLRDKYNGTRPGIRTSVSTQCPTRSTPGLLVAPSRRRCLRWSTMTRSTGSLFHRSTSILSFKPWHP